MRPGAPIDASAKLPDGTKFNGPAELRKVLLSHSDEFLTTDHRKAVDLRARARARVDRRAGGAQHQARRRARELPVCVARPGHRHEHAVSDEDGAATLMTERLHHG